MNYKRAFLTLLVLMLLPALTMAQVTARFEVSKIWQDGTGSIDTQTTAVAVNITCTTGLPLIQDAMITTGANVDFVLGDLVSLDDVDCVITETTPSGYVASYSANNAGASLVSCSFKGGQSGNASADNTCRITNTPGPVNVTVYTDWEIIRHGGIEVDDKTNITIRCDAPIAGTSGSGGYWAKTCLGLVGDNSCSASVTPAPSGSSCTAWDSVTDSSVEKVIDGCSSMPISPGSGNSCLFSYTVFFEGIPTLSQYGLAIMALLMLGVGFVGFRRFV